MVGCAAGLSAACVGKSGNNRGGTAVETAVTSHTVGVVCVEGCEGLGMRDVSGGVAEG